MSTQKFEYLPPPNCHFCGEFRRTNLKECPVCGYKLCIFCHSDVKNGLKQKGKDVLCP
jgi:hypothetical protein